MTTDADRIEELAKLLDAIALHIKKTNGNYHYQLPKAIIEYPNILRSLSAELAELRQAKESLDWWIGEYLSGRNFNWNLMPPYLKSRLEGK